MARCTDVMSSEMNDIRMVNRLRTELERLDADVRFWTEVIEDFSHHDEGGGQSSFSNPKENAIVRRADALSELDEKREALMKAEALLTERLSTLEVRAEVRRATYLHYVRGFSLDHIGRLMNYSKTQVHRMKEEGREVYEREYV